MQAVGTDVTVSSTVWLSVGPAGARGQASPGKTEGPPPWNAGNDRHPYYLPPPQVPASRADAKDAYSCYLIPVQGSGEAHTRIGTYTHAHTCTHGHAHAAKP